MAKKETANLERTYNIPLRKEYQKVPCWKRSKKAVRAAKEFLQKHMKSDDVKLSKELNEKIWQHGIKNPPHHVKVNVTKDKEGVVRAELFGAKAEAKVEKKQVKKPAKKVAEPVKEKEEKVVEATEAKKSEPAQEQKKEEAPKVEEKKEITKEKVEEPKLEVKEVPKAEKKPAEEKSS